MLKFYKNKPQIFKCRVEIQGADSPKVIPRLIFSPKNGAKLFFEGKYNDKHCEIDIAHNLDIANKGDVVLEIIANDTIFTPWKSTYEIVSNKAVVENIELIDKKNNISVKLIDSIKEEKEEIDNKYTDYIKKIPSDKRKKVLEHILHSFKPKKQILEWSQKQFNDTNSLKAKMAMFYKQNKHILIKEDIKTKFPEVEEWDRKKQGSMLNWEVVSKKDWKMDKAEDFQEQAGYSPLGYGGPYNFKSKKNIDGTYTITWQSGATS
jgi:CRISPR/Cas system CMR-associated protein Cmr5 small subunit